MFLVFLLNLGGAGAGAAPVGPTVHVRTATIGTTQNTSVKRSRS